MAKSFEERAKLHKSPVARQLLTIIHEKSTNLCASLDVTSTEELLCLAEKVGPYVCMIKTHIDIIDNFEFDKTIKGLVHLAHKYNFLIFEDRKFADIGSTVKAQYSRGVFRIAEWADITNAHGVPGPGIVQGLESGAHEATDKPRALLMLAELSSKGSLAVGEYTKRTIEIAEENPGFVIGFIAQNKIVDSKEDFLILTPGVGLDSSGDQFGQQYRNIEDVIAGGSDVIIVGRGLYGNGRDPIYEAKRYRDAAWAAYLRRL